VKQSSINRLDRTSTEDITEVTAINEKYQRKITGLQKHDYYADLINWSQ